MKALDRVEHENGYSVMARGPADVTLFGKLAHCIRERTAVIDTHAADPRTHPVGGPDGNVRILAVGAEWTVENFLALIAAARQRLTLQEQLDAVDVDAGEDELDRRHAALEALGEADAHVRGILTLHRAGRIDLAALGAFAFWLATWLDERVERILCKHNVCLAHAGLGVPSAIQVRHVRQALPTILRRYVRGDVDSGQFFDELWQAYALGAVPAPRPRAERATPFEAAPGQTDYRRLVAPEEYTTGPLRLKLVDPDPPSPHVEQ